jgi:effector-binding domain-containing protein
MTDYPISVKPGEPLRVASIRAVVPDYGSTSGLIKEVFQELGKAGIPPAGPALAIYYDEGYKARDVDIEAAVPIGAAKAVDMGRVSVRELPAPEHVVSLMRTGPYDDFRPAYDVIMQWVQANGYRIAGPNREIYHRGPGQSPPSEYLTEIQFPVVKAG